MKPKVLWIGDAGVPTGFAKATHEILETVRHTCDVTVLGINYRGDPHAYKYPIWAASAGGDGFGVGRLIWMCDLVKPDVIIIQQDGWNIPSYTQKLRAKKSDGSFAFPEYADIPVIAAVAVDGKNFHAPWLKDVALTIFWTNFARTEAHDAGFTGEDVVIPLGVDLSVFMPLDRQSARTARGLESISDSFIVGNVNRNQPRKRWDLTLRYFSKWIHRYGIQDAYLYMHTAPTGETTTNVEALAKYYGIHDRLALAIPAEWYGVTEEEMCDTYNTFDVQITTTQGEGFGLTTFEGMACGIPQIVPDWSALGELTKDAAVQVPCTSTAIGMPFVNVIGGVPDEEAFINALHLMYTNQAKREEIAQMGINRVTEPQYRWKHVGEQFRAAISDTLRKVRDDAWQDLGRPEEVA